MRELMNYQSKQPNGLTKALWKAAGADANVLQQCSYSDHVKYAAIGGIIFFTAFLAAISAGFALYTIFSDKSASADNTGALIMSIIFAILWGIMIFNLDRFIVAATGKGDGKEGISWYDLKLGWPRILLATIIGIVISAPLEVKIMQPEIEAQLLVDQQQRLDSLKASKKRDFESKDEVITLNARIKRLQEEETNLRNQAKVNYELMSAENRTENGGCGPKCRKFEAIAREFETKADAKKKEYELLDAEKKALEKKMIDDRIDEETKVVRNASGLMSRLIMAEDYADEHGSPVPWLIRLFFVILEITPVLTKMMLIKSPYDYLDDNLHEIIKAKEGVEIRRSFLKDENGKDIAKPEYYVPRQIIREQEEIIKAQEELSSYVINKYKEREKGNIDQNLDAYIKKDKDQA